MVGPIKTSFVPGSVKVSSRASEPRTSSNRSFSDQVHSGVRSGVKFGAQAIGTIARPLPGGAALANTLRMGAGELQDSNSSSAPTDPVSLHEEMKRSNQEYLNKQQQIYQEKNRVELASTLMKKQQDIKESVLRNMTR